MKALLWAGASAVGIGLLAAGPVDQASGATIQRSEYDYWHRKRANRGVYKSVGQVRISGGGVCSGVLIGGRYVLTAAHCVDSATAIRFHVRGRNIGAQKWIVPNSWDRRYWEGNDIAIIRLNRPIRRVPGARLPGRVTRHGSIVNSVGYGMTGTGASGQVTFDARKRLVRNRVDVRDRAVRRQLIYDFDRAPTSSNWTPGIADLFDLHDDGSIDYDADMYPIGLEGATAQGDSGGGVFRGRTVVGIHSWGIGIGNLGTFGGLSYSTSVAHWRRWITINIRRLATRRPLRAALVGSPGNPIFAGGGPVEQFRFEFLSLPEAGTFVYGGAGGTVYHTPEPGTFAVMGLGGLFLLRRPRRRDGDTDPASTA